MLVYLQVVYIFMCVFLDALKEFGIPFNYNRSTISTSVYVMLTMNPRLSRLHSLNLLLPPLYVNICSS